MEKLAHKNSDIVLTIADNTISNDQLCKDLLSIHMQKWDNIKLKGVVNPFEELSKCWVYLYPFNTPHGTMAFAMSIYEASTIGKPVIACDIGSNREFFPNINLIPQSKISDSDYLTELIEAVILNER